LDPELLVLLELVEEPLDELEPEPESDFGLLSVFAAGSDFVSAFVLLSDLASALLSDFSPASVLR
jgi:hypothetical protein